MVIRFQFLCDSQVDPSPTHILFFIIGIFYIHKAPRKGYLKRSRDSSAMLYLEVRDCVRHLLCRQTNHIYRQVETL